MTEDSNSLPGPSALLQDHPEGEPSWCDEEMLCDLHGSSWDDVLSTYNCKCPMYTYSKLYKACIEQQCVTTHCCIASSVLVNRVGTY